MPKKKSGSRSGAQVVFEERRDVPQHLTQDDFDRREYFSVIIDRPATPPASSKAGSQKAVADQAVIDWMGLQCIGRWPEEESVEAIKAKGNAAYKEGDLSSAAELYTHALEVASNGLGHRSTTSAVLYCNRSKVYSDQGRWEESASDARMSVIINNAYPKGYYRWAFAARKLGFLGNAASIAQEGIGMCYVAEGRRNNPALVALVKEVAEEINALGVDNLDLLQGSMMLMLDDGVDPSPSANPNQRGLEALMKKSNEALGALGSKLGSMLSPRDMVTLMQYATGTDVCLSKGPGACRVLQALKAKGIARTLVNDWPTFLKGSDEAADYVYCSDLGGDDKGDGPLVKLVLSDPEALEPLLFALSNDCSLVWMNSQRNLQKNAGASKQTLSGIMMAIWEAFLPLQMDRRATAARCIGRLLARGDLSAPQVERVVEVCCSVLRSVHQPVPGHRAALNRAKPHLRVLMSPVLELLVSLKEAGWASQASAALPALRCAAMADALDLDQYGSWADILKAFDLYPDGGIDQVLSLDTNKVRMGRRLYEMLRLKAASSRGGFGASLYPIPDSSFDWGNPKCTNFNCGVLATAKSPHGSFCPQCHTPYCSPQCMEEDNHPSVICGMGRYEPPPPACAAEEEEDGKSSHQRLHSCDCCGQRERYPRQFRRCMCRAARYCSPGCQKVAWQRLGHRADCCYRQ